MATQVIDLEERVNGPAGQSAHVRLMPDSLLLHFFYCFRQPFSLLFTCMIIKKFEKIFSCCHFHFLNRNIFHFLSLQQGERELQLREQ